MGCKSNVQMVSVVLTGSEILLFSYHVDLISLDHVLQLAHILYIYA